MARHRFEYVFELKNFSPPFMPDPLIDTTWRNPSFVDQQILADLMLDSYRDTIDYDAETIHDALREVESYFSEQHGDSTWLNRSWLGLIKEELVCASLVGFWKVEALPSFLM